MHLTNLEKTSFVIERGIYCYNVMSFGLKNAEATYQCLVNKMFSKFFGETMEFYIGDMLVKPLHAVDHILHLQQAFSILDSYHMKLNPEK